MTPKAKEARYQRIYEQIKELISPVNNRYSRMATISAIVHHKMNFFWTGFYLLEKGELIVGPYRGPLACLHLKKHKGVCWAGIDRKESVLVDNVEEFPDHIACSSLSKSEIVVPVYNGSEIIGCMDIDSRELNTFDEIDKKSIEKIVSLIFY